MSGRCALRLVAQSRVLQTAKPVGRMVMCTYSGPWPVVRLPSGLGHPCSRSSAYREAMCLSLATTSSALRVTLSFAAWKSRYTRICSSVGSMIPSATRINSSKVNLLANGFFLVISVCYQYATAVHPRRLLLRARNGPGLPSRRWGECTNS